MAKAKATAVVAVVAPVPEADGLLCIYPRCVAAGHCLGHDRSTGVTILDSDLARR